MIEEQARVIAAEEEGFAWVQTERQSTCGACAANKACGTSVLSKVLGQKPSRVRALNPVGARLGDQVVVGLQEEAMVRGSLAIYAVPLIAMIVAAIGVEVLQPFGWSGDGATALGGIFGLGLGLLWVRGFSRRILHDARYQPVILRRITPVHSAVDGVFAP